MVAVALLPASALAQEPQESQESPPVAACAPGTGHAAAGGECRPLDGPCESNSDCAEGSACLAGQCTQGRRFQRVEVFVDGIPVTLGEWILIDRNGVDNLDRESFTLTGGVGFSSRAFWAINPRWLLGFYAGYWHLRDGHLDDDQAAVPKDVPVGDIRLRVLRSGFLGAYRWPAHRTFTCGVGLEGGFLVGTSGNAGIGAEIAPDFFFDVPLSSGVPRWYLTLSFGIRVGGIEHSLGARPVHYWEHWNYFMPVIRLGVGLGR